MRHPLHPALVHFPVACWTLATAADVAGLLLDGPDPWRLALALLAIGCAFGALAAAAGFLELLKLPAEHPAFALANAHMGLALLTWCLYSASLFLRLHGGLAWPPGTPALALSGAGLLGLLATGWLGGRLVYGHAVGMGASAQSAAQPASRRS